MDEEQDRLSELEELRQAAVELEAKRDVMGDAVVDATLAAIQAQIASLESDAPAGAAGDEVHGDKVGADKVEGDKAGRDLAKIEHADRVTIQYGEGMPEDDRPLQVYLHTVARRSGRLPLGPLDPAGQESAHISLGEVFVGLDAGLGERQAAEPDKEWRFTAALAHIHDNRRLILLGDPGSGKSTLLRFLALCLSGAALDDEESWLGRLRWSESLVAVESRTSQVELGPDVEMTLREREDPSSEPVERQWTAGAPIPIPVTLRDFAQEEFEPDSPVALWDHIARRLEIEDLEDAAVPLRREAQEGRVIFLLDGVDEVPAAQRARVWGAITALASGPYGGNRWLATCRLLSFSEKEAPPGVPAQGLQPFGEEQVDAFINSWYGTLAEAGEFGGEQAGNMARSLQSAARRPRLGALAQNPMLLTIMALVQTYHGTLPDERARLYQACVETLLLRWQRHKETTADGSLLPEVLAQLDTTTEKLQRLLWEIAWDTHRETAGREEAADIPEDRVMAIARRHLGSYARAEAFLAYTERRAHLLVGRGGVSQRVYSFPHRTFQEYLAACHLAAGRRFPQDAARLAAEPTLWREVLNLAAGTLVFNQNNREKALDGVYSVLPGTPPEPDDAAGWNRVWLAGEMVVVVGRETAEADEVGRELLPRLTGQLVALLEGGRLAPRQRAEAGDVLGLLGDPRPGVCTPEPEMLPIPAGPFLMGGLGGEEKDEIQLESFAIARYPVSNAQFRFFVEDGGYTEKWRDCWTHEGWDARQSRDWTEPRYWQDAFWSIDNKPVVGVSWYEAVAYANWLGRTTGRAFRLSTEAEWERAARHTDGREWPWGDEWQDGIVNSDEAGVGRTMAVGSFPGGTAVCGAQDMSGNVWEWCQTRYWDEDEQKYPLPYRPDDGREELSGGDRVTRGLRGGAFDINLRNVRAAYRDDLFPLGGYNAIGFRVVEHLS